MINWLPVNDRPKELSFVQKLHQWAIVEKFANPAGIITLAFSSVFFAFVVVKMGVGIGALLLLGIVGLPMVYGIVTYPKFGIIVLLTAAYFIMLIIALANSTFPLGTVMDALEGLLILGFLIRQKINRDYSFLKNPISKIILIWVGYNLLEVGNPSASSVMAWVYTVRTVAFVTLMYFVFVLNINTLKFIRLIVVMWLLYSVAGALYGVKQEVFGFSGFESRVLQADPERAALYFIEGHWRKFSFFNDPVVFAYNMVLSSLLCIGLSWGTRKVWKKVVLFSCMILFITSMLFSGTRGAYALIPAGLILYWILNFNGKILAVMIIATAVFLTVILVPSNNPVIHRFQSAFKPGKDASYIVRQRNQARIRPFIWTHPMGGGLGSVGVWGQKFSPGSMLASFPPDSGYVRVAVEMGTIGIILFCILMFIILRTGIVNFYKIKNREIKAYCLAMTIMIFAINVGNYPQEALVQFPTNIYFYLMAAILSNCLDLDKQLEAEQKILLNPARA